MDFAALRQDMVDHQIAARGVRDARVLRAMRSVPRERFVGPDHGGRAYEDGPLSIGRGQTISQPFVVALMVEALGLAGSERALEVGTGSGYGAAVLSQLAREVFTMERHPDLARGAAAQLAALGYTNVHVVEGDGSLGLPEQGPYDAIVVTAGGPRVPPALVSQLAPGGRLIIPVGQTPERQHLLRIERRPDGGVVERDLGKVAFVPLVGQQGW